eukprot:TRINITY_DN1892_c0_g1_i1.p1 TRINITY_DN1892_c0_g1~~TRINITY_DN1892_c0_g1_i1.p1  ORF type:complete len:254 (+),score=88.87 TRINITY_DN1892_c0_g1_i1:549-1310(+)
MEKKIKEKRKKSRTEKIESDKPASQAVDDTGEKPAELKAIKITIKREVKERDSQENGEETAKKKQKKNNDEDEKQEIEIKTEITNGTKKRNRVEMESESDQKEDSSADQEGGSTEENQLVEVKDRAFAIVDDSLTTDACLLFPPSRIALAALIIAGKEKNFPIVSYLRQSFERNQHLDRFESILSGSEEINRLVLAGGVDVDRKKAQEVLKKIKVSASSRKNKLDTNGEEENARKKIKVSSPINMEKYLVDKE